MTTGRSLSRSNAHFQKAKQVLPLGVASNFRYWGDDQTIYIKKGKGARLWDLDNNEYIDYRLGYGPAILGYADDRVDEAARQAMSVGGVFALATERELTVAERIAKMVPSAEMVRFSNSGTEAVMAAIRLARGYTGKDSIVIVEGGYHGLFDAVMWNREVEDWDESVDADPPLVPYGDGIPDIARQLVHTVPLNNIEKLEAVLKAHSEQIGALLIEPIMGNCCSITAEVDYLKKVRELCTQFSVVMIIDEVKTGFRVAKGGVQEMMGVQADLCTFAKAIANGYPMSVVAGKREIMSKIGDGVAHGGTYTAHSVSLGAAEKTLEILDETPALDTIAQYGTDLRDGLGQILSAKGVPHCFTGHPALSGLYFNETPPTNYRDWKNNDYTLYDALAPELHDRGILIEPDSREPWFMCEAHDQYCLTKTLTAFEDALNVTLESLSRDKSTLTSTM